MKKKAAFVGLTNIDYIYYLDSVPDVNSKAKTGNYARYIGGPAANAAITYATLGGDATLITAFGESSEGNMIENELSSYGVNIINLSCDSKLPGISTILVTADGSRTIISGQSSFSQIDFEKIAETDFDFALFDCNQSDIALPVLGMLSCEIVLDAGSYKPDTAEFLKKASIVISSEKFADMNGSNIFEMNYPNISHKAITRGEKSILLPNKELAVKKVNCVDSLAAGDILHGAFCYAYYEMENSFEDALTWASDIASESVRYKGPRAVFSTKTDLSIFGGIVAC